MVTPLKKEQLENCDRKASFPGIGDHILVQQKSMEGKQAMVTIKGPWKFPLPVNLPRRLRWWQHSSYSM